MVSNLKMLRRDFYDLFSYRVLYFFCNVNVFLCVFFLLLQKLYWWYMILYSFTRVPFFFITVRLFFLVQYPLNHVTLQLFWHNVIMLHCFLSPKPFPHLSEEPFLSTTVIPKADLHIIFCLNLLQFYLVLNLSHYK